MVIYPLQFFPSKGCGIEINKLNKNDQGKWRYLYQNYNLLFDIKNTEGVIAHDSGVI